MLLCAGREAAATSGDPVADEVMRARGDMSYVRERLCAAAAGASRPACGTLQEAMTALDETKVVGETASSAADVAHGFDDAVASLLDAENLITEGAGKQAGVSNSMIGAVNKALAKVQQAQSEMREAAAVDGINLTGNRVQSSAKAGNRVGVLGLIAVCLNLAAVVLLACLVWAGPFTRKACAKGGGAESLNELRAAAVEAASSYATLLEQNRRYQGQVKQLAGENKGLRRLLEPMEGRGAGRVSTMERTSDFGSAAGEMDEAAAGVPETGDLEISEAGLTKSGPARSPIVMEVAPAIEASDARHPTTPAARRAGDAERPHQEVEAATNNPLADYRKARATGGPEEEAQFKRKYAPFYSLACTNLAQRGIAGARLTFKQDPRASFLAVTASEGRTLLFPQFSKELAFTPGMMEGVFVYPAGVISELTLTQAAEVEAAGEEWVLVRPGLFEHA